MDFKIVWTPLALSQLEKIVTYLKENWSVKVQNNFFHSLSNKVELLTMFPSMGMKFSDRNYRKLLITEHSYLHYRIKGNNIILLTIKDTRQNTNTKN